jgi:hypothetical protein
LQTFKTVEPLSNFVIIEKCKELKIKNFKGVFMRDELKTLATSNECLIINTDHSNNEGTHWTSLFIKDNTSYYFDPYGIQPMREVEDYCNGCDDRFYSSFEIQKMNEIICGHYCIFVLYALSNGSDFYDICLSLVAIP